MGKQLKRDDRDAAQLERFHSMTGTKKARTKKQRYKVARAIAEVFGKRRRTVSPEKARKALGWYASIPVPARGPHPTLGNAEIVPPGPPCDAVDGH